MGQKVHPYGFRLGYNKDWHSHWYAKKQYGEFLLEDLKLKRDLKHRFAGAGEDESMAVQQALILFICSFRLHPSSF